MVVSLTGAANATPVQAKTNASENPTVLHMEQSPKWFPYQKLHLPFETLACDGTFLEAGALSVGAAAVRRDVAPVDAAVELVFYLRRLREKALVGADMLAYRYAPGGLVR
jgi:hypothetical protein